MKSSGNQPDGFGRKLLKSCRQSVWVAGLKKCQILGDCLRGALFQRLVHTILPLHPLKGLNVLIGDLNVVHVLAPPHQLPHPPPLPRQSRLPARQRLGCPLAPGRMPPSPPPMPLPAAALLGLRASAFSAPAPGEYLWQHPRLEHNFGTADFHQPRKAG